MLVLETPTKLRLPRAWQGSRLEEELGDLLGYEDLRVTHEWRRYVKMQKSADRAAADGRQAPWYVQKHGRAALDALVAQLSAQRAQTCLFKDEAGLWTYSGLAAQVQEISGDTEIRRDYQLPAPQRIAWQKLPRHEPRWYQEQVTNDLLAIGHGGAELATGLGKSYVIALLLKRLGLPALVMAPTLSIAYQLLADLTELFGQRHVGQFFDGKKQCNKRFVVAVSRSLTVLPDEAPLWNNLKERSVLIGDECFPSEARVLTEKGQRTISSVVSGVNRGEQIWVKSWNGAKWASSRVTAGMRRPMPAMMLKIRCHNKTVRCTHNHPFLTTDGWKRADQLCDKDIILGFDEKGKRSSGLRMLNDDQGALVDGSFLGDGSVSSGPCKSAYRLRMNHSKSQEQYASWKRTLLQGASWDFFSKGFKIGAPMVGVSSPMFWSSTQFPSRKRTVPQDLLARLDLRRVAIWFMDDGSGNGTNTAAFHTESFSEDTVDRLVTCLARLGIVAFKRKSKNKYWQIKLLKDGYEALSKAIAPFVHPSMAYKLHSNCRNEAGSYRWSDSFLPTAAFPVYGTSEYLTKVQSKRRECENYVYDIEIEGTHNFLVSPTKSSAGWLIAHNCHMLPAETLSKVVLGHLAEIPYRFFLSGTQLRTDGLQIVLEGIVGRLVLSVDVLQGVKEGFLSPLRFFEFSVSSETNFNSDEVMRLNRVHLHKNPQVYRHAAKIARWAQAHGRRPLVMVEEVSQFKPFLEVYGAGRVGFAHGGVTKDNRDTVPEAFWKSDPMSLVKSFDAGELDVLVGTSCIGMGTDIRSVGLIVDLVGDSAEARLRQRVGRGTRLYPDKQDCIYACYSIRNVPKLEKQAEKRAKILEDIMKTPIKRQQI